MVLSPMSTLSHGKVPKAIREYSENNGGDSPYAGLPVAVKGPNGTMCQERQIYLADVVASTHSHPIDPETLSRFPRQFRFTNPLELCKDPLKKASQAVATTEAVFLRARGNVGLVASGAFSKSQFATEMGYLQRKFGDEFEVTVIDARKECHWLGTYQAMNFNMETEPFSEHTRTNHQNLGLTADEIKIREENYAKLGERKLWVCFDEEQLIPSCLRHYTKIETEEQYLTTFPNVSYHRMPLDDHHSLTQETVLKVYDLVKSIFNRAQQAGAKTQVLHVHCLGGKGRTSEMSALIMMAVRWLKDKQTPCLNAIIKDIANAGGRRLDDIDEKKTYKLNGAKCRLGIIESTHTAFSRSSNEEDLLQAIPQEFENFIQKHSTEWANQVDPTEFAETDGSESSDTDE